MSKNTHTQLTLNSALLWLIAIVFALVLNPAAYAANSTTQKVFEQDSAIALFILINQRLQFMPDVALYKAQNNLAIEHLEREQNVLKAAIASSKKQGLQAQSVKQFFQSQMDVAKAIQYRYRADLLSDPIEKPAPDLNKSIRPALIKLGDEIIVEMGRHINKYGKIDPSLNKLFDNSINHQYISKRDKQLLFQGLTKIR